MKEYSKENMDIVQTALLTKIFLKNSKNTKVKEKHECPICNNEMVDIQVCHLMCFYCGANMDCSDKGTVW